MGWSNDYDDYWNDYFSSEEKLTQTLYTEMCKALGYALCNWQYVERAHFKLFLKLLDAPNWETCSAAYYSIESFEARHKMVGRVAHYFLKNDQFKSHRETWCGLGGGLEKEIKNANENRNKIAHYGLDFVDINATINIRMPALQPTSDNLVDQLVGRIPSNPEHSLSPGRINGYAQGFYELAQRIGQFEKSLILSPQHEPSSEPMPAHPTDHKSRQRRSRTKSPPTDDRPSD